MLINIAVTNHAILTDSRDGSTITTGTLCRDEDDDLIYVLPWAKPRKGGGGDPHRHGDTIVPGMEPSIITGDCNLPGEFNCQGLAKRPELVSDEKGNWTAKP